MDLERKRNMGALRLKRNEGEWRLRQFMLGGKEVSECRQWPGSHYQFRGEGHWQREGELGEIHGPVLQWEHLLGNSDKR